VSVRQLLLLGDCGGNYETFTTPLPTPLADPKPAIGKAFSQEKMNTVRRQRNANVIPTSKYAPLPMYSILKEQKLEFVNYAYDPAREKSKYYTLEDIFIYVE